MQRLSKTQALNVIPNFKHSMRFSEISQDHKTDPPCRWHLSSIACTVSTNTSGYTQVFNARKYSKSKENQTAAWTNHIELHDNSVALTKHLIMWTNSLLDIEKPCFGKPQCTCLWLGVFVRASVLSWSRIPQCTTWISKIWQCAKHGFYFSSTTRAFNACGYMYKL